MTICKFCHEDKIGPCDDHSVKLECPNYLKMVGLYDERPDNDARLSSDPAMAERGFTERETGLDTPKGGRKAPPEWQDELWTTKDGRVLKVGDMAEDHVRNALRMIIRRRREMKEKLENKPSFRRYIALKLLHEVFEDLRKKSDEARAEMDQKMHEDIMNDIGDNADDH
jgi:hypothetical protein